MSRFGNPVDRRVAGLRGALCAVMFASLLDAGYASADPVRREDDASARMFVTATIAPTCTFDTVTGVVMGCTKNTAWSMSLQRARDACDAGDVEVDCVPEETAIVRTYYF
jgi:hypothetical protein